MQLKKMEPRRAEISAVWGVVEFPGMVVASIDHKHRMGAPGVARREEVLWEVWIDLSKGVEDCGIWPAEDIRNARNWLWNLEPDEGDDPNIKQFDVGWQIANELADKSFTNRNSLLQAIHTALEDKLHY